MSPAADSLSSLTKEAATTATAPTTSTVAQTVQRVEESLPEPARVLLGKSIFGIALWQYIAAFVFVLVGLSARRLVIYFLTRYSKAERKGRWELDQHLAEAATHPLGFTAAMLGVLGAVKVLTLVKSLDTFATNLIISIFYVNAAWLLFNVIALLADYLTRFARRTDTRLDEQLIPILRTSLKVFVVVIVTLQVISQMGADIKGLLAGIGLGGLAFALAARDSIANIFGSVVILSDRPFRVGDWIEAEGVEGTVEEIGFRSTRIRTFAKALVTVPNSKVANWAVNNWSAIPMRRVKMTVGISYEATPGQMEAAVEGIRDILRHHRGVHQEFFLVSFTDFGASALEIFLYYFTVTTVWAEYLEVRQEINLAIMRLLEQLRLEIAYPTQTVYVRKSEPPALPRDFGEPPPEPPEGPATSA